MVINMIIDKLSRLNRYPQFEKVGELIFSFVQKYESETIKPGKYCLDGDNVFALVQKYSTKSKQASYMESHKKYADFQYIVRGAEIIYYAITDELAIREDKFIESDIAFYEAQQEKGMIILEKGMFGYFEPQDAHMPCIQNGDKVEEVEKIVFKVRLPQT